MKIDGNQPIDPSRLSQISNSYSTTDVNKIEQMSYIMEVLTNFTYGELFPQMEKLYDGMTWLINNHRPLNEIANFLNRAIDLVNDSGILSSTTLPHWDTSDQGKNGFSFIHFMAALSHSIEKSGFPALSTWTQKLSDYNGPWNADSVFKLFQGFYNTLYSTIRSGIYQMCLGQMPQNNFFE